MESLQRIRPKELQAVQGFEIRNADVRACEQDNVFILIIGQIINELIES